MELEMAAGFAAVLASLIAIALLVLVSRRIIEKSHRRSLAAEENADRGVIR
jgi:hypothetical protein